MEHHKLNEEDIDLGGDPFAAGIPAAGGPIFLDSERCAARIDDRVLALTRLEFEILAYLAQHRGEVISQEELVGRVTRGVYNPTSSVIRVHVSHLRRKLGLKGIVETVRGRGFRFGEHWEANEGLAFAHRPPPPWQRNGRTHEGEPALDPIHEASPPSSQSQV